MNNALQSLKPKWESFKESLYLLFRNPLSAAALIVILILVLSAVFAPLLVPYPQDIANEAHISEKLLPPSSAHWFGTDELGRDVFSRVVYGGRISLGAGLREAVLHRGIYFFDEMLQFSRYFVVSLL